MQLQLASCLLLCICKIEAELITDSNNCLTQNEVRFKPAWTKLYQRNYDLTDIGADLLQSLKIFEHGGNLRNNRFITSSLYNCIGLVSQVPLEKFSPNNHYQFLDTLVMKSGAHAVGYFQDRYMSLTKIKAELSQIYSSGG